MTLFILLIAYYLKKQLNHSESTPKRYILPYKKKFDPVK